MMPDNDCPHRWGEPEQGFLGEHEARKYTCKRCGATYISSTTRRERPPSDRAHDIILSHLRAKQPRFLYVNSQLAWDISRALAEAGLLIKDEEDAS